MIRFTVLLVIAMLLSACDTEYQPFETQVLKGIVSDKKTGRPGRFQQRPKVYIQTSKKTVAVEIPFANEYDFKVGDSIILVVQTIVKKK